MKKAFHIQLISYVPLLKAAGIRYRAEEKMLMTGEPNDQAGYALFVSCRTLDTPKLLEILLPLLRETSVSFRLVKDQQTQYRLNSGDFGESEVGKVLSVFPASLVSAKYIADKLCELTNTFRGPTVMQAQRIGEVTYVQTVHQHGKQLQLSLPKRSGFPFSVPAEYRQRKFSSKLLGSAYLPVQTLRSAPKGNIYKAINLKGFAFDWCLVKQGNPVALDDHFDRDMRDRLLWQKEVILRVQGTVITPCFIDHFERDGSSYLVTGFAEGHSLSRSVRDLLSGQEWHVLLTDQKARLLGWYLKALAIVAQIHEAGFVHRDITDSNFIVLKDDSLCVIDFELAYSLERQEPDPPFLLGTFGYAAPEQLEYAVPDMKEDIYSLGALLAFILTGCPAREFLNASGQVIKAKLKRLTRSDTLASIVIRCLALQRKDRPSITFLQEQIKTHLQTLNNDHYEDQSLAS